VNPMDLFNFRSDKNKTQIVCIVAYSICSASMLLVNKLAQHALVQRVPSFLTLTQLAVCSVVVMALPNSMHKKCGGPIDKFEWEKMKPFFIYCCSFVGGLYCNMRALSVSNIETVIVFRACTPLAVCVLDYFYLGRSVPSPKSLAGLALIALGSAGYMFNDAQFAMDGLTAYTWAFLYFFLLCFNMVFGKAITRDVKLTLSGNVLYTNAISCPLILAFGVVMGETEALQEVQLTSEAIAFVAFSCVIGTGIAYAGWWCRSMVSATTYTVVGVINKLLTVLVNVLIWDNHASMIGITCLLLCLIGAVVYEPAPLRHPPVARVASKSDLKIPPADDAKGLTTSV